MIRWYRFQGPDGLIYRYPFTSGGECMAWIAKAEDEGEFMELLGVVE